MLKWIACLLLLPQMALAQNQELTAAPLTFNAWKEQQILEAQNQILRLKATPNNNPNLEKQLKRARDGQLTAMELTLEEYVLVYLPSLQNNPDSIAKLMEKLTKEETAKIIQSLLKRSDASRNKPGSIAVIENPRQ